MYTDLALYIDGAWHDGKGRKGEEVINPATEKPLAHLPHASKADLDHALESAKKGFATWRNTSAYDRCKIMRKAADLMRERHDHISKVMVQEQGKVYVEARAEVLVSADIIDWYAEEGRRSYGRIVPGRVKGVRQLVTRVFFALEGLQPTDESWDVEAWARTHKEAFLEQCREWMRDCPACHGEPVAFSRTS